MRLCQDCNMPLYDADGIHICPHDTVQIHDTKNVNTGDWVLIKGMRREYPYVICYYCSQITLDGEGDYDAEIGNEMNHLQILSVKKIEE